MRNWRKWVYIYIYSDMKIRRGFGEAVKRISTTILQSSSKITLLLVTCCVQIIAWRRAQAWASFGSWRPTALIDFALRKFPLASLKYIPAPKDVRSLKIDASILHFMKLCGGGLQIVSIVVVGPGWWGWWVELICCHWEYCCMASERASAGWVCCCSQSFVFRVCQMDPIQL